MKRKKIEKIFKKSIEVYGKEAQSRQAMEECAELVQAINKCLRYPNKEAVSYTHLKNWEYYKDDIKRYGVDRFAIKKDGAARCV